MLHYVALCEQACNALDLFTAGSSSPQLAALAQTLSKQWFGLLPGFHRFLLDHGQVVLTLCVGNTMGLLQAQQFQADAVELSIPSAPPADMPWLLKALARCCRRGTVLRLHGVQPAGHLALQGALVQFGFRAATKDCAAPDWVHGQFDPPWALKNTRQGSAASALPIERCAVIGAGLAGASVAAALARRGWQVRVLDQADAPAAEASGLPVGLVVPHVSSDDCVLSRLSRAGVRMMLQNARDLLTMGKDWAPSGVLERQVGGTPKLPATWPEAGTQWTDKFSDPKAHQQLGAGLWHHQGAWIKPANLVNAWLDQPGITFQPHAKVADMRRNGADWELLDELGNALCVAERVVFANASGAFDLLLKLQHFSECLRGVVAHLPSTHGMRGMLSWQMHKTPVDISFPAFPVNGAGSMVPGVPVDDGVAWFMGSSYQPDSQVERSDTDNQAINFEHLQQLMPHLAQHLAAAFSANALHRWKNTRCVTKDRLPAVGPLEKSEQPSLWLCAGMGSRGLSFSVLCAELLAARMGAEPWPLEAKLARSLDALRA
jgi:tRNA 5-methylaminomethyl-2-thiouridine biosynthesis bifunctional protein